MVNLENFGALVMLATEFQSIQKGSCRKCLEIMTESGLERVIDGSIFLVNGGS